MDSDETIEPIDFARAFELATHVANTHRTIRKYATVDQILADYHFMTQAQQAVRAVDALHGRELFNVQPWLLENIDYCHREIRPLLYSKWP